MLSLSQFITTQFTLKSINMKACREDMAAHPEDQDMGVAQDTDGNQATKDGKHRESIITSIYYI